MIRSVVHALCFLAGALATVTVMVYAALRDYYKGGKESA